MYSKLDPWLRIDSLKTFYYSHLLFLMCTVQFSKTDWHGIDDSVRPMIKRTLDLPPNAGNEYLFSSKEDGLFGIPLAAKDFDIALTDEEGRWF